MNLHKYVNQLHVILPSRNYRAFSVCCRNKDNEKYRVPYETNKIKLMAPYLYSTRNLSFEAFVKWQEQSYISISNSYPVNIIQDGLVHFHNFTGLPWWASIVMSTLLMRTIMTFPLMVYQKQILAKVEIISLELKDMLNDLKRETAMAKKFYNLTTKQAVSLHKRSLKKQWVKLIERDNCHPFKASLVVWFQIPFWVCMSFALRNLVNTTGGDPAALITLIELSTGGIGWIPNLIEPDRSLILPVAFGLITLSNIELMRMSKLRQPSKLFNIVTNVFRVFSIVMIPVAASVPSCMCLYWVTSSSIGLMHNVILLSPPVRRNFRIPLAPSELEQPYIHIKNEIRERILRIMPKKS